MTPETKYSNCNLEDWLVSPKLQRSTRLLSTLLSIRVISLRLRITKLAVWQSGLNGRQPSTKNYRRWTNTRLDVEPCGSQRVVKARWVFTQKINGETGQPSAYKARWVAKGYSQVAGLDYNELYAGVAHKDTIRVLLALSAHFNYELDQVDIKAAFLNGELEEKIYLEPPEGSEQAPSSDFASHCTVSSNLLNVSTINSNNGLSVRVLSRQRPTRAYSSENTRLLSSSFRYTLMIS